MLPRGSLQRHLPFYDKNFMEFFPELGVSREILCKFARVM